MATRTRRLPTTGLGGFARLSAPARFPHLGIAPPNQTVRVADRMLTRAMTTPFAHRSLRQAALSMGLAGSLLVASCGSSTFEPPRNFSEFDLPEEAPYGERGDPPIMTLEVAPLRLRYVDDAATYDLPAINVGPVSVTAQPLGSVLDALLADTDIAYTLDEDAIELELTLRQPTQAPLQQVMERISTITGVHYRYRDGLLLVEAEREYIMQIPRMGESLGALSGAFGDLGANNVSDDEGSGVVTFTANRNVARRVREYLARFWDSRDVIVYDIFVLEVTLNNDRNVGIAWDNLSVTELFGENINLTSQFTGAFTGIVNTVSGEVGDVSFNSIIGFLQTQGEVRALANPSVSLLSGTDVTLNVGQNNVYISNIQRSVDDDTGEVVTSVETDEVDSAVEVELAGTYSDGTVYTELTLSITQLLEFATFSTGGGADSVTLQLPVSTERELETNVPIRPGDTLVVGGLIQENVNDTREDMALLNIPLRRSNDRNRSELVILLQPRVVQYRPADTYQYTYQPEDYASSGLPQDVPYDK